MTPKLLRALPDPSLMKARLRTFSMLDAVLSPDFRSFEFHPKWGKGETMGAFKDGSGNAFFCWFSKRGAVVRGFDHESVMSPFRKEPTSLWPGMWEGLPKSLDAARVEPAFVEDEVTFACWCLPPEHRWRSGPVKVPPGKDADGSAELLACFRPNFRAWATSYYDQSLDAEALTAIWRGEPLDRSLVQRLNPDFDVRAVREEAKALGWPIDEASFRGSRTQKPARRPAKPARPAKKPATKSFGAAEFVVRCCPDRVTMTIHGGEVVAQAKVDVYDEIFEWVKARLRSAR